MNQPIYKDQNLQDQAFVGLDLTGADFSGSDLRGCDFTRATLIGTNFDRVVTGQTQQQISTAILSVVMGAIAIFVIAAILGFIIVAIDNLLFGWFGETYRKISSIFPAIILFGLYFFQGNILAWFPKTTNFFGNASIGILWLVMLFLTLGLGATSFSGGSGSSLFLIPTVISAIVTFKVFTWLIASIKSRVGTSFKKANLTEASFSHALIENTDFSLALLTGICVDGWLLDSYTLFTKSQCDYLYWKPQKDRYPHHDDFQGDELEKFLSQFTTQK
jgi:uncharacterized protein YjbI with pentapeptide repeats